MARQRSGYNSNLMNPLFFKHTNKKTGSSYSYPGIAGQAQTINGNWSIEFLNGGPVLPAKRSINQLGSWTELQGDEVKNFSGTARYSVEFARPSASASSWLLDLGKVHETAEVFLNGKKLATLIGPVFQVSFLRLHFYKTINLKLLWQT